MVLDSLDKLIWAKILFLLPTDQDYVKTVIALVPKKYQEYFITDKEMCRQRRLRFTVYVGFNGYHQWTYKGKLHREDGPAVIHTGGDEAWYKDGSRHREGGPAAIYANGHKAWFKDGLRHREDGPAVIRPDGYESWYKDGNEYDPYDNPHDNLNS